jgi:NAD(P)-dependent dehydrogenase (short-subunit alcohol dehydrogenase family)
MSFRLDGKVAIVTAAAQGLGLATARIMAQLGAAVVLAGRTEATTKAAAASIVAAGGKASGIQVDVRHEDSVRAMIAYAHETYGRIDILHNNAGGSDHARDLDAADITDDAWDDIFAWNMDSTRWGCRYALPLMIAGGGGSIINTISCVAAFAGQGLTAYGASKAAVASYTRHVAVQYGRRNIRCNAISPGLIMTPHVQEATPVPIREVLAKHITTPRLGIPDDVGHLAAFLASDVSAYINGQVITIDGGVSARFPHDADVAEMAAH